MVTYSVKGITGRKPPEACLSGKSSNVWKRWSFSNYVSFKAFILDRKNAGWILNVSAISLVLALLASIIRSGPSGINNAPAKRKACHSGLQYSGISSFR
ncbi:hypothetical protein GSbR_15480 [Geobacter sp. SVR]|nr:hypothetical protein GSVR_00690 [Geobacter sp. SVR]GCF84948.1 hypothetical protein GSbR_15480 [Geobacter sp. SVR]